jgi:FkbM family methyltransferase
LALGISSKINAFRRSTRIVVGPAGLVRMSEVLAKTRVAKMWGREFGPVPVRMKALDGAPLAIRPGTSDLQDALEFYTLGLYLPDPRAGLSEPRQIVELGCNIGAALTALGVRFPTAALLGVEPAAESIALARRNTAIFGSRCTLVQSAIWDTPTELVVDRGGGKGAYGFRVRPRLPADPPEEAAIPALDIDSLLRRYMPDGPIDHMLLNIEGTERRVLEAGGEWLGRVRSLNIESQPEYGFGAEECMALLTEHGFDCERLPRFPKFISAVRAGRP